MSIDRQRIAAVRALKEAGYVWTGERWQAPADGAAPSRLPLTEYDLQQLRGAICRFFATSYERTTPLIDEIRAWGWFRKQ